MSAALRAAQGSNNAGGGTSLTMTAPTGVVDGDVMVMAVTARGGTDTAAYPTWTTRTSSFGTTDISGVAFGDGQFVAVGGTKIATSPDGSAWTQRPTTPFTGNINAVAYGNGLWVAGGGGEIGTSTNGLDWTLQTVPSPMSGQNINAVAYGNGMWVAVGSAGGIATSPDGVTWTTRTNPAGSDALFGVAYGNDTFAAVYANGIIGSPTGVAWASYTAAPSGAGLTGVTFGEVPVAFFSGLFVATTNSGDVYTSDGTSVGSSWIQHAVQGMTQIYDVTYGGGVFCVIGNSSAVATAVDPTIAWLPHQWTTSNTPNAVAYGKGVFVGVATAGDMATGPAWGALRGAFDSTTTLRQEHWWKVATSEPASYTITLTPTAKASGVIVAVAAASRRPPADSQYDGQVNASSVNVVAPALSAWDANSGIDIGLFGTATGTTFTPPTNYTEPANADTAGSGGGAGTRTTTEGSYRALSGVTTVGSITAVAASAAVNVGFHVFLFDAHSLVYADRPVRRNTLLRR